MSDTSERTALADIEGRLIAEFPAVAASDVTATVLGAYRQFSGSRIRDFIPLFVEKNARRQLSTTAG